jgi:hypothetical protein
MSSATKAFLLTVFFLLYLGSQATAEKAPTAIAGIRLGSNVDEYPDIVESNFMKEVVVTDWHGFRKGVISYGNCRYSNQILKIDMKYEDKSKVLYDQLLKKFRKKFGDADLWLGDSFGVKHIWKWYFTDEEGNRVSLRLQHNTKDANETLGNMVKLAYPDLINKERECFNEVCDETMSKASAERREELKKTGWSYLVPE